MHYRRLKPRPISGLGNKETQENFKLTLALQKEESDVALWFLDESGIESNGMPNRIWALSGSNPELYYNGERQRENLLAAVRPADGKLVSVVMSTSVDTDAFQFFLDELKGQVNRKKINLCILDNATYHKTAELQWGSLIPWFLPAYSPQLNPIERIWLNLKQTYFYLFATVEKEKFSEAVDQALRYYMSEPNICKSICSGQI